MTGQYEDCSAEAVGNSNDSVALASIAISLKRIADAMEKPPVLGVRPIDVESIKTAIRSFEETGLTQKQEDIRKAVENAREFIRNGGRTKAKRFKL